MKNDLLKGNPIRAVILFALPIMASSLLQYSYNFVDNIIVGRYVGTEALAAAISVQSTVSLSAPPLALQADSPFPWRKNSARRIIRQ